MPSRASKPSIETSGDIAARLYADLPELIVGCADLEAPTNHKRDLTAFDARDYSGRYIHCGVREHAMGALANGMAAHGGAVPLAVTYLTFSDYERPAMRFGWDRWIGPDGIFIGMRGFGASGPADALYRHFGITADAVVDAVRSKLAAPDVR